MNDSVTARLMDVKRFAVHDGLGIRTTLFLKGCSLRCVWCHNPEGIAAAPQLAYYAHKCISCGECEAVCPQGAHSMTDGLHRFDRARCRACGRCVPGCLGEALQLFGCSITVEEAAAIALEDRVSMSSRAAASRFPAASLCCRPISAPRLPKNCARSTLPPRSIPAAAFRGTRLKSCFHWLKFSCLISIRSIRMRIKTDRTR